MVLLIVYFVMRGMLPAMTNVLFKRSNIWILFLISIFSFIALSCGSRGDYPSSYSSTSIYAPENLTGSALTIESIILTWDKVPGAKYYKIEYSLQGDNFSLVGGGDSLVETNFTHLGLTPFSNYFYRVIAVSGEKISHPSKVFSIHLSMDWDSMNVGSAEKLDIGSFNIQHFPKDGYSSVELAAQAIKAMDLDIIVLQEMENFNSFDIMLDLAEIYEGTMSTSAAYNINLGVIYNPDTIELLDLFEIFPSDILAFARQPLVAQFSYNGGQPFWVINIHNKCCGDGYLELDNQYDEENRRLVASQKMVSWVAENHPDEPVIILGDWNDEITDSDYSNVFMPFYDNEEDWFFADMDIAEDSEALWSYPQWPSHLDHILLSEEFIDIFKNAKTEVQVVPLHHFFFGGLSEMDDALTDHLPIVISFPQMP
jgi:endonuclease/exonuclease/phosphatase family metal-dependent hydrolase